jgi:Histone methylation protein DOT1
MHRSVWRNLLDLYNTASRATPRAPWRSVELVMHRMQDAWFDWRWNVDTSTQATSLLEGRALQSALKHFGIAPQGTFVELGSGKGRTLLHATLAGFTRAVGVELAPELAAIAQENARRLIKRHGAGDITTLCMDATRYEFKVEDRLLLLHGHLGPSTVQAVVAQLCQSLERSPRTFNVLHAQPDFADMLTTAAPLRARASMISGGVKFTWLQQPPPAAV